MKKNLPRLAAAAATALACLLPAHAASPEIRAFRADYGALLDDMQASLERNGNTRDAGLLARARSTLQRVNDDSFEQLFQGGAPDLSRALESMRSRPVSLAKSAGLPAAQPIHPACTDSYDSDHVYQALVAAQVTQAVLDAANYGCVQDILGANGSLACVPLAVANSVAQGIYAVRAWCAGEAGGAKSDASYERLAHVHDDLSEARSTILSTSTSNLNTILASITTNTSTINNNINASTNAINNNINTSTASIIANDNSNRTTIVNNANANKDAIVGELRAVACEIIRLLNTPDGQRASSIQACTAQPGFPYSWNKK